MPPQNPQPTQPIPAKPHEMSILTMRVLALTLGGAIFFALVFAFTSTPKTAEAPATSANTTMFEKLPLEAQSVLVWDARDDRPIFARDARKALPLASISKLMTAIVAREAIAENAVITISGTALATDGDNGLTLGERWTRDALIEYVLVTSSNDGAAALAEAGGGTATFVSHMNEKAKTENLVDTSFVNPTGLDEDGGATVNRGSAYDVANLFVSAQKILPDILDATRFTENSIASIDRVHTMNNTNEIADRIPWAIGGKTGFTDAAGGNLVVSFDVSIGHPIVVVVLGSSREGRFDDVEKLIDATHEYFDAAENGTVDA